MIDTSGISNALRIAQVQQANAVEWHIKKLLRLGHSFYEMERWTLQGNPFDETLVLHGVPLFTISIDPDTLWVWVDRLAKPDSGRLMWNPEVVSDGNTIARRL